MTASAKRACGLSLGGGWPDLDFADDSAVGQKGISLGQ